jgi:hypothetical protein
VAIATEPDGGAEPGIPLHVLLREHAGGGLLDGVVAHLGEAPPRHGAVQADFADGIAAQVEAHHGLGGPPTQRFSAAAWYLGTKIPMSHTADDSPLVERVQTGVRLEKRLLKVLKALADYHDLSLGDLLEGIVLHAFEGKAPFDKASLRRIAELKSVFGLTLEARHAHRLREQPRRRR